MRGLFVLILILSITITNVKAEPIHDLQYTDLSGNKASFNKFEGKPLLVDTFATWCEPCKTEILNLMEMYDSLSVVLNLFTIDVSPATDDINDIISFRNDFGAPWEFGLDQDGSFSRRFATVVIPTLYLFDEEGEILDQWVGVTEPDTLLKDLEEILNVDFEEIDSNYLGRLSSQLLENGLLKITGSFMVITLFYILIVPTKPEEEVQNAILTKSDKN